jgi:hypothetical protein
MICHFCKNQFQENYFHIVYIPYCDRYVSACGYEIDGVSFRKKEQDRLLEERIYKMEKIT